MMLVRRFPMLVRRSHLALLTLAIWVSSGCGPEVLLQGPAATARALVRPLVAGNALTVTDPRDASSGTAVQPGPTAVVLGHRAEDGSLRVGCVDSEDGAASLVLGPEDTR
jgi:hypothetical protein